MILVVICCLKIQFWQLQVKTLIAKFRMWLFVMQYVAATMGAKIWCEESQ